MANAQTARTPDVLAAAVESGDEGHNDILFKAKISILRDLESGGEVDTQEMINL